MLDSVVKVCFPAGIRELEERMGWREMPQAKELWATGKAEPGVELKVRLTDLPLLAEAVKHLGIFYQLHLPPMVANEDWEDWFTDKDLNKVESSIEATFEPLRQAKPFCVILHGYGFRQNANLHFEDARRFLCPVGAEEYRHCLERYIELLCWFQEKDIPIAAENMMVIEEGSSQLPNDYYLDIQIPHLPLDLRYVQEKSGSRLVWDIDHHQETCCFYKRQGPFRGIPRQKELPPDVSRAEYGLWKKAGLFVRQGEYPLTLSPTYGKKAWESFLAVLRPQVIHVQGDMRLAPKGEKRQHRPLSLDDDLRRRQICAALVVGAEVFVLEVQGYHPLHSPSRSSDALKESFLALCKILTELL